MKQNLISVLALVFFAAATSTAYGVSLETSLSNKFQGTYEFNAARSSGNCRLSAKEQINVRITRNSKFGLNLRLDRSNSGKTLFVFDFINQGKRKETVEDYDSGDDFWGHYRYQISQTTYRFGKLQASSMFTGTNWTYLFPITTSNRDQPVILEKTDPMTLRFSEAGTEATYGHNCFLRKIN